MSYQYFIAADGARLAFCDSGQGIPVLALAGLTRDGRDFDYLLQQHPACRLIRLDSRGRGHSQWTGAETYTVAQEAKDALALLDHLGLAKAAVLGTSRGGLIGMLLASFAHERLLGLCLNDVGPALERPGLQRILEHVGIPPSVDSLAGVADLLPKRSPGFANVSETRWEEEAVRRFSESPDGVGLTYDPDLRRSFETALSGPQSEAWPLFEACVGLPIVLIRGANSDVLSNTTAEKMCRLRPDMLFATVPDRGHPPFLDEPEALSVITAWFALMKSEAISAPSN